MRKFNLKTKTFNVLLVCSLCFFAITFNSCDKAGQLDGTTWEGDCDFDSEYYDESYDGTVSISFTGEDVDILSKFKVEDEYGDSYSENHKGTGTFTYEKKNISIKIKWKESFIDKIDDGKWSGTVDKNTMTLKNVYGETVKFKKQ